MRFKFALLISTMFLLVSCTEKAEPVRRHEPAAHSQPESKPLTISEQPEEGYTPSRHAQGWKAKASASSDVLKEIILPLSRIVLSPNRIAEPSSMNSRAVMDELMVFNSMILQLKPEDRARPEFKEIMRHYQNALYTGCGSFTDSCRGLRYFRLSANSAQVVKLMSQIDTVNRYKLLMYALKLKNNNWDQELVFLLFADPQKTVSESESKFKDSIRSLMGTALLTANDKFKDSQETRDFLEGIHAWKLSEAEIRKFDAPVRNAFYAMIAKAGFIYGEDKAYHPDFSVLLKRMEASEESLLFLQKKLQKDGILTPELIGATSIGNYDELYYIIESVFTGQMESSSAAQLFVTSKRSSQDLFTAVRNYVRLQFMIALNKSTDMAIKLFNADVVGQDLVFHYIKESNSIRTVWSGFISNSQPIHSFAVKALRQRSGSEHELRELESLFASTHRSINLASAYPHTLTLFHILSQKRFKLSFDGGFKTFDTGDLLTALFLGDLNLLQRYSDEKVIFNQFQLVYAFDMAVRTNLFKKVGIDPDYFIADALRRLNGKVIDQIDLVLGDARTRFATTPIYDDLKGTCAEINGGAKYKREIPLMDIVLSPLYGKLARMSQVDVENVQSSPSTVKGGLPKMNLGIFYADRRFTEMSERARLDLGNNLRLGRSMLESYASSLRKQGVSQEEIEQRTQLSRKAIAFVEGKRREVLESAKLWHEELGKCYLKIIHSNYQSFPKILEMEKAYLRQAYRDVQRLRAAGVTEEEKEKILKRHQFHGLPGDFKGQNQISERGLIYTQIDFILRTAGYLTKGLVTDNETFPPIAPQIEVYVGEDLDPDRAHISRTTSYFIAAGATAEEFANSGVRVVLNGYKSNTNYVTWLSEGQYYLTNWSRFMASLTTLYRMENEIEGGNKYFTVDTLMKVHEGFLTTLKMTDAEKAMQKDIGFSEKVSLINLGKRVVTLDEDNKYLAAQGLYDLPLIMMANEQLGSSWNNRDSGMSDHIGARPGMFRGGTMYYSTRAKENRGQSIIPYNAELDDYMDGQMIAFVGGELRAIQDFNKLTKSYIEDVVAKLPEEDRPRADVNISLSITEPLLSDHLVPSFKYHVDKFNRSTGLCFVLDTKCSAFQQ